MTQEKVSIEKITIDETEIFLDELGNNRGKITVSNIYGHNYSYFWGAMGGTLKNFILNIDSGYFASKLMGSESIYKMSVKKTFAEIRRFIREEIGLQFYHVPAFQKHMREVLNEFQRSMEEQENKDLFVAYFDSWFINFLDFSLIEDRFERDRIEKEFKGICEVWNFIQDEPNERYKWLCKLHKQLQAAIKISPSTPTTNENE